MPSPRKPRPRGCKSRTPRGIPRGSCKGEASFASSVVGCFTYYNTDDVDIFRLAHKQSHEEVDDFPEGGRPGHEGQHHRGAEPDLVPAYVIGAVQAAAHVSGPTTPSTPNPFSAWN